MQSDSVHIIGLFLIIFLCSYTVDLRPNSLWPLRCSSKGGFHRITLRQKQNNANCNTGKNDGEKPLPTGHGGAHFEFQYLEAEVDGSL